MNIASQAALLVLRSSLISLGQQTALDPEGWGPVIFSHSEIEGVD
jgi:hypothetical protein